MTDTATTHPGTADVAAYLGLSVVTVRAAARLAGCPRAEGGHGYRFTSVDAFEIWLRRLPEDQRLAVPALARGVKRRWAEEIAQRTWTLPECRDWSVNRLARLPVKRLRKLLAEWRLRDGEGA